MRVQNCVSLPHFATRFALLLSSRVASKQDVPLGTSFFVRGRADGFVLRLPSKMARLSTKRYLRTSDSGNLRVKALFNKIGMLPNSSLSRLPDGLA